MARGILCGFDRTNPVEEFRTTTVGATGGTVAIETYTTSTRTGSGRAVRIVRSGALVAGGVSGELSIIGNNTGYNSFVLRLSMRVPSGITNANWISYFRASGPDGECRVQVRRNANNFDLRLADEDNLNTVDCGSGYAYDAWHEVGFMRNVAPATDEWALRIGGGTMFETTHDYVGAADATLRLGFTDVSTENAEVVFDDIITERHTTDAIDMDAVNDGRWLVLLLPSADDSLGFPGAAPHFSTVNDQSDATTITAADANTYVDTYVYDDVAGAMPIPADTLPTSTPVRSVAVLMRGNQNAIGGTVTGRLTINGVTTSTSTHTSTFATSAGCATSTGPFSIATLNAGRMGIRYTSALAGTAGTYAEVWGYAEIEASVAHTHNLRSGGSTETISSLTTTVTTSDVPVHSTVHDITVTFDLDGTETDSAASPDVDVTLEVDDVPTFDGTPDKVEFTAGGGRRIFPTYD